MITSRQIVDIINDELQKDLNESQRNILNNVKNKIEILEEIEFVHMHKQAAKPQKTEARLEAEKFFK